MTEVTSEPRAFVRHLRENKMCTHGARLWWARREWSWQDFLTNGIPIRVLLETGDPHAQKVADTAMKEVNRGR